MQDKNRTLIQNRSSLFSEPSRPQSQNPQKPKRKKPQARYFMWTTVPPLLGFGSWRWRNVVSFPCAFAKLQKANITFVMC